MTYTKLFRSGCGYSPHFVENYMFRGYSPHPVEISTSRGYSPHFVNIIRIGHITSYLAFNVHHGLHSLVLVVDIIYIGDTVRYLACNICPIFHIYSYCESDWCNSNIY